MDIFSLRLDHYPLPFDTPVGRRAGVGAHYEVKNGSEIAKYYMAGSTHIAMRKYTIPQNMTVEYMLGDHLGSTSLTADVNGNKVLEIRYKAWGEIRATWTSSPSTTPAYKMPLYQYTGQASYMDDPLTSGVTEGFGLMFYQSRWYDPQLSRFSQADTIVPGGVQGLDRYAAMNNNPVRYNDPTGHQTCDKQDENGNCMSEQKETMSAIVEQNNRLAKRVKNNKLNDLQAFAQLVEYAASLTPGCMKCLIQNIGSVITGFSKGDYILSELTGSPRDLNYWKADDFGQSGYAPEFQDPPSVVAAGGGNQAFHFWFYVQAAFESGANLANAGVIAHETVIGNPKGMSLQDTYLGYEAVNLGNQMAAGTISTSDVADYILQTLSPGSAASQFYQPFLAPPKAYYWINIP